MAVPGRTPKARMRPRRYRPCSIVVVVAEHGPRRRWNFAHHDHDRLCTGLDGAVVDEVFDDPFDVIEQLALSFTEAFDRHGRLRLVEIDDHDLRLAGFILLSRLPMFGSARRGGCHLHLLQLSSSSSSSSNSIFGIPEWRRLAHLFESLLARLHEVAGIVDHPAVSTFGNGI